MGRRELTAAYGGNIAKAVNRAIRSELPGGNELLDFREWLYLNDGALKQRLGEPYIGELLAQVNQTYLAMAREIRRRYGMQTEEAQA
jgi:hypothetical protein